MKKYFLYFLCILLTSNLNAQNIGIGTTNPHLSAKLDITDSTKGLLIPRLTTIQRTAIASPAKGLIVFDSTTNSLWYHDGTTWGELSAVNASTWNKTGNNIYNTNSGNIGIGTLSPSDKLEINGNIRFSIANPYINSSSFILIPGGAFFNDRIVYFANLMQARGGVNNDYGTLTLTGSNNLVNSASAYFQVAGKYAIDGTDGYLRLNQQNSFPNGTYTPYNLMTDGKVGIGTNPPNFPLSFASNIGDKISLFGNSGAHYGLGILNGLLQIHADVLSSDIAFGYGSSSALTERMRIKGNGNVGIGTTTPATRLDILGGNWDLSGTEGDVRIGNSFYRLKIGVALAGGGAGSVGIMQFGQPGGYNVLALGAQGMNVVYINGTTARAGIGTDNPSEKLQVIGNVRADAFLTPSDLRLKKDVQPIKKAVDKIIKLNGYTYHWKDENQGTSLQSGVIAQEVQKTMPELVKVDEKGMLSVNYSGLIPYLIQSIKEQQEQIQLLEKENNELEAKTSRINQQQQQINELLEEIQLIKAKLK